MIKLFNKDEQSFSTLGLGALTDCIKCEITNELNGQYELSLQYPMSGAHYEDLILDRIIVCKPDRYSDEQAFRIYSISKPLGGRVTVKAAHISYDMNYYPIKDISATSLNDLLSKVGSASVINTPFKFVNPTTEDVTKVFETTKIRSLRSLFYSATGSKSASTNDNKSIIEEYECDVKPDNFTFNVYPKGKLGSNNGLTIRYGKNLTDMTQDSNAGTQVTGVFPLYASTTSERTSSVMTYQKVYVVRGKTPVFNDITQIEWLQTDDSETAEPSYLQNLISLIRPTVTKKPVAVLIESTTNHPTSYGGHYVGYDGLNGYVDLGTTIDQTVYEPNYPISSVDYETVYHNISLYEEDEHGVVTNNGIVYVPGHEEDYYQKILILDLSSNFDEEPTKAALREEAEKYIKENNLGDPTINVKASFILLSSSSEYSQFINAERFNLGDTITVIYEALGVSDTMRVTSISYDCVKDEYVSVELGERQPTFSSNVLYKNDKLSYLRNDKKFVNEPQVADVVGDGVNHAAGFTEEQILTLQLAKFNAPGIIEASSTTMDQIVAKLLVANDAYIANELVAGNVTVKGNIEAMTGVFHGTVNAEGNDQSKIKHLSSDSVNTKEGSIDDLSSNSIKSKSIKIADGTTLDTIKSNNYTYYRDTSHDTPGYWYGWHTDDPGAGNQKDVVTQSATPNVGDLIYYADTFSFMDVVIDYDADGYYKEDFAQLEIGYASGSTSTQTVTYSAVATYSKDNNYMYVNVRVTGSNAGPEDITVIVPWTLYYQTSDGVQGNMQGSTSCLIPSGLKMSNWTESKVMNRWGLLIPTSVSIGTLNPASKTFTIYTGGSSLAQIDNHFAPKTTNTYSLGYAGRLWKDVYAQNTTIQQSDARVKKDISYDLDKYAELFDKLKPASFKLKNGESGRTHVGLIAQDLKQAMDESKISSDDFAAYVKYLEDESIENPKEEDYSYAIRYGELISLCIYEIQKLKAQIKELESKEGS